jgi:hypothetical protein
MMMEEILVVFVVLFSGVVHDDGGNIGCVCGAVFWTYVPVIGNE